MQFGTRVPSHRDAHKFDVCRLRFLPSFEVGIEHEASAASVPKDFDDFDFVGAHRGRLRRRHHTIIAPRLPFARRQILLGEYRRGNDGSNGQQQRQETCACDHRVILRCDSISADLGYSSRGCAYLLRSVVWRSWSSCDHCATWSVPQYSHCDSAARFGNRAAA